MNTNKNTGNIEISELKFSHYFRALEFDVIFSVLSNVMQIICSFYLFVGIGIQNYLILGLSCLFSWMTIFKFFKHRKKFSLMY